MLQLQKTPPFIRAFPHFTVSIPKDKVDRVISLTADALASCSMTIHEAQQLAVLLSLTEEPHPSTRPRGHASVQGMRAFYFDDHAPHLSPEHAPALPLPNRNPHEPFEITALLRAFEAWSQQWRKKLVVIHTDSSTTQLGLIKQTLKAKSQNEPLRQLLLLAAQLDIKIEPHHLPREETGLADALSRDLQDHIANWCPHWQNSFHSLSRQ
ncbi:hypothetical protein V8E54_015060 [Elaphomyces granulatus]